MATLDADDKAWLTSQFNAVKTEVGQVPAEVVGYKYGDPAYPTRTVGNVLKDLMALRDWQVGGGNPEGTGGFTPKAGSPAAQLAALPGAVAALATAVAKSTDDADKAEILTAIEATRLGNPDQTAEDIADALRAVLGERAAEVGGLLAGPGA